MKKEQSHNFHLFKFVCNIKKYTYLLCICWEVFIELEPSRIFGVITENNTILLLSLLLIYRILFEYIK
jgi:hypothetical protein